MMRKVSQFLILLVLLIAGCNELIDLEPRSLPDLALSYKSSWDMCSASELYHSVTVENIGTAPASRFHVDVLGADEVVDGLDVGEAITFPLLDTIYLSVTVDSENEIDESDESSNSLSLFGGTSTRPCFTPTPLE
jgi:subtilase family serine protease